MLAVYADERMYTFTGGGPPDAAALLHRYQRLAIGWNDARTERWCNWIVREHGCPAPIGAMQATMVADASQASVAWEIAVSQWGRGCAGGAARAMVDWLGESGVERITASIHPSHTASATVARRLGFVPTQDVDDGETVWLRVCV